MKKKKSEKIFQAGIILSQMDTLGKTDSLDNSLWPFPTGWIFGHFVQHKLSLNW